MNAIVREHELILEQLKGGPEIGIRPNYNDIEAAFRVHMQNAARESWQIADGDGLMPQIVSPPSSAYENERDASAARPPLSYPFLMRYCAELTAVWNLAIAPARNVSLLDYHHQKMQSIIAQAERRGTVSDKMEKDFINADIAFHCSICVQGRVFFGQWIVTSVWRALHNLHNKSVNHKHMKTVVQQHEKILDAIRRSNGGVKRANAACVAMEQHLCSAFIGHNLEKEEQEQTVEMLKSLAGQLGRMWPRRK